MRVRTTFLFLVFFVTALIPLPAFAGQSIVLTTGSVSSPVPAQPDSGACRLEMSIHDWDDNPSGPYSHAWNGAACGFDITFYNFGNGDLRLQFYSSQEVGGGVCIIPIGVFQGKPAVPSKFVTVRYQRVPQLIKNVRTPRGLNGPGGVDLCEATDINGNTFYSSSEPYKGASGSISSGVMVGGGAGWKVSTAYFRLFNTTVPLGSRPPVTADVGNVVELKFDGNLSDSSPNKYDGKISGGTPAYVPTPGQNLVVAVLNTLNHPVWSPWASMRVGSPNQLDCSNSYSQADASSAVSCSWTVSGGPTAPTWSSQSTAQPVLTNLSFGTYNLQLVVKDANGNTATTTLPVGAVAYDDNGVVIPDDPKVTEIFGPMIAFGKNPWGYADERAKRAVELQNAYYVSQNINHPTWLVNGQGTVSYPFAGIGPSPGQPGTTLSGAITATSTSISISDAGKLPSLGSLPTWIWIGNADHQQELVRICNTTSTSGAANLTACYDGRGLAGATGSFVPAQAWAGGTIVGEFRISGKGTLFVTDSNSPLCPGGAPGPPGPVVYSAGTVSVSGGSAKILGNGTSWTTANSVLGGYYVRIAATHGGSPFVFWAGINTVDNSTQLSLNRALPADTDPGPFSYKIISYRYVSLHFTTPDGTDQQMLHTTQGCESETAAFAVTSHDIPIFDAKNFTGVFYSYKDSLGIQSAFGPNFYGSGLASLAFYLRSGWTFAKQTAEMIDNTWVRDPEIAAGWVGGIPLLQGGGVIGAFAEVLLNRDTTLKWTDVRQFAANGAYITSSGCNAYDTRDSGYLAAWLTLGANYDPDSASRQSWKTSLNAMYQRDLKCKGSDNSWANGFLFGPNGPALTVTQGSSTATGSNIPQSLCFGIASGTVNVVNGQPSFTGKGLVDGNKINISGTLGGNPYVGVFQFTQKGGVAGTLAVLWPGDTGSFSYVIENNDLLSTIAVDNNDPQLKKNWACTWNNAAQITLNRPWEGPSESNAHISSYILSGFGQQPYMLGIKTTSMKWASQNDDTTLASEYATLASSAAEWIRQVGYDANTQGMNYGRIFQACEPTVVATPFLPTSDFVARTPGCNYGLDPSAVRAARVLTAEASQALRVDYESNPTSDRKNWADVAYGSIWGYCPYTAPGYYCDANYVKDENSDASLSAYKWAGFFFGVGMSHQWPAVRVGTGH